MSWFKRRPKIKEPEKLSPNKYSPMSMNYLNENKIKVQAKETKLPKKK